MIGANDAELYTQDHFARHNETQKVVTTTVNGDTTEKNITKESSENDTQAANRAGDVAMADAQETITNGSTEENRKSKEAEATPDTKAADGQAETAQNGPQEEQNSADNEGDSFIHPIFRPPTTAKPDRDLGLPGHEAEDIRRLLALYVQKQEEVCRGTSKLHRGLLKAQRLRGEVLHWSKAEAHCGPNRDMSDGEDWYDKEEWGLTEDLKKGQDEEEEEVTTQGKKTRNRRA